MLNLEAEVSGIRWLEAQNQNGETVPSGGLVRFTGYDYTIGLIACDKPDADGQDVLINGPTPMEGAGAGGAVTFDFPAWAVYDPADGQPAFGEVWGAAANDWRLRKGKSGFKVLTFRETDFMALVVPEKGSESGFFANIAGPAATSVIPFEAGGFMEAGKYSFLTTFVGTGGREFFYSAPQEVELTGTSNQNQIQILAPVGHPSGVTQYRVYGRSKLGPYGSNAWGLLGTAAVNSSPFFTSPPPNQNNFPNYRMGLAWEEVERIANGDFQTKLGGRSGTTYRNPAFEVNRSLYFQGGTIIWLRKGFTNPEPMGLDYSFEGGMTGLIRTLVRTTCVGNIKVDYFRDLRFSNGRLMDPGQPEI